jgi:hypothetical protein
MPNLNIITPFVVVSLEIKVHFAVRRTYLKNAIFWTVTPYGSCKDGKFRRNITPPSSGRQESAS